METWPHEGLVAAIERGSLPDWRRVYDTLVASPYGETAAGLDEYLTYADADGAPVMRLLLEHARRFAGRP